MANSERKIIRGVRTGGKTYLPGMEDELNAMISPDEAIRLVEKSYLHGSWTGKARVKEAPKEK